MEGRLKMIPKEKCGECEFQDEQKVCVNYTCLSYKERVLDGYVACDRFAPRKTQIHAPISASEVEKLKPGKCQSCILEGKCLLKPSACPGTLDKTMSKILLEDKSPMGVVFKRLIEDIITAADRRKI